MAHPITPAIKRAYIIRRGSCWACARACKLRLLWYLLLAHLLRRHTRVLDSAWILVWTLTRRAIRAQGPLFGRVALLLVLGRRAAWGWEMLLHMLGWRRILRRWLSAAGGRWVVLVLLLERGGRGRRWRVGLAWRRREVLLLVCGG